MISAIARGGRLTLRRGLATIRVERSAASADIFVALVEGRGHCEALCNANGVDAPPEGGFFDGEEGTLAWSHSGVQRVLFAGLGALGSDAKEPTQEAILAASGAAFEELAARKVESAVVALPLTACPSTTAALVATAAVLGDYSFDRHITDPERRRFRLQSVSLLLPPETSFEDLKAVRAATERAVAVAESTNFARDMGNARPQEATPAFYEAAAASLASEYPGSVTMRVLQEPELREEGLNMLAAVGQASVR